MLEVKSPWNEKMLEQGPRCDDGVIGAVGAKAISAAEDRGLDFPPD